MAQRRAQRSRELAVDQRVSVSGSVNQVPENKALVRKDDAVDLQEAMEGYNKVLEELGVLRLRVENNVRKKDRETANMLDAQILEVIEDVITLRRQNQTYINVMAQLSKENSQFRELRKEDRKTGYLTYPEFSTRALSKLRDRRLAENDHNSDKTRRFHLFLFIDVAGFKAYNSNVNPMETDRIMAILAPVLQQHLRSKDFIARLMDQGDEFIAYVDLDDESRFDKGMALFTARRVAKNLRYAASTIDWRGVKVLLRDSVINEFQNRIFPYQRDELGAGKRVHLKFEKEETYGYLDAHPIGLDINCLLLELGNEDKHGEKPGKRDERLNAHLSHIIGKASEMVTTHLKDGERNPRPGRILISKVSIQDDQPAEPEVIQKVRD
jgi:GGDEF domain-containing protein